MHPDGKAAAEQQICGSQCPLHFAFTHLLRFRHIDEFSFQQEQMHKFGGSGSVLGEGGLISYPRGGGGARVPGWDPAPGQQPPAPSTATNAFTPIWPAVPAQKRSLSQEPAAPGSKHFSGGEKYLTW